MGATCGLSQRSLHQAQLQFHGEFVDQFNFCGTHRFAWRNIVGYSPNQFIAESSVHAIARAEYNGKRLQLVDTRSTHRFSMTSMQSCCGMIVLVFQTTWSVATFLLHADSENDLGFEGVGRARRWLSAFHPFSEALLLCWEKGQQSPIHDHSGAFFSPSSCLLLLFLRSHRCSLLHKDAKWKDTSYSAASQTTTADSATI